MDPQQKRNEARAEIRKFVDALTDAGMADLSITAQLRQRLDGSTADATTAPAKAKAKARV